MSRNCRTPYISVSRLTASTRNRRVASSPEGRTDYFQADLRDPDAILGAAARTLDFSKPVAVMLLAVLHFIPDTDGPHAIVKRLLGAVPPGSYLVVQHAPSDIRADEMAASARHYNAAAAAAIGARSRDQVARFFDGLEMVGPGLVDLPQWWPAEELGSGVTSYVGIGRKPGGTS